jgi:hypothetical protein
MPCAKLRRITLTRTLLNKGIKRARAAKNPGLYLERTVGLEPTLPYKKYDALQSCVRKNSTIPY